ncbi:tape measure protein [Paenibacillus contaminans]|nr:tape measure protein [Paenibacillus contaminans]
MARLSDIRLRIQIQLPASINVFFTNLQRLVYRLLAAVRRLGQSGGKGGCCEGSPPQQETNDDAQQGGKSTRSWLDNLKGIASFISSINFKAVGDAMKASDAYMSTQAGIGLIADGQKGETAKGLQQSIFEAAERSKSDYMAMAQNVVKLDFQAGDMFSGNNETIAFAELMQKAFKLSVTDAAGQQSGMDQLTKAMAAGKLQGDEFSSIMENAPMLADAIAKFTGKSKSELKAMAEEGGIAANILKGALFSSADDINKKFEAMPRTFGDVFVSLKNRAFIALGPAIERISQLLSSAGGTAFLDGLTDVMMLAGMAANGLVEALIWIGSAIQWIYGVFEPLFAAIGGAFLLWGMTQIPMLITKLWLMVEPILAQASAWMIANWPILLIGAAIGLLIYALYSWEDATAVVVGFVGGIFGVLVAFLFNIFAGFANMVLSIAEFFINIWNDTVYGVKKLFYDLVISSLESLRKLASGIESILNKIPGLQGVTITAGLDSTLTALKQNRNQLQNNNNVVTLKRFEQMDYGDAFQTGQVWGEKASHFASDKIKDAVGGLAGLFSLPGFPGVDATAVKMDQVGKIGEVGEVGKINDTVDISSEDLKMMRELAEMKNIQNFVSLTPTVSVTTGDINNGEDADRIVARIQTMLTEQISSSAQGVYA